MKSYSLSEVEKNLKKYDCRNEITYFIRDDSNGLIKIGKSEIGLFPRRLSTLQIGNPRPLLIVGVVVGNVEKELHAKCKQYRVRGEWYMAGPSLTEYINKYGEKMKEQPMWKRGWK